MVVAVIAVALFAFNRWGRYDDHADLQGTWYVIGTEVPITIDAETIRFNEEVSYNYEINSREKTISYTFGPMAGQGRYWFSDDRKHLVITDGDGYTAAGTTVDDLIHAFLDFSTSAGGGIVEMPQGEGIIAFCYISTPATFISGLPVTFLQVFLTAAAIMLVIVIIFVATMSYSMAKPLRQMSSAAKKFAVGDFSARVEVNSDDEIGELANAFNYMADSLSSSEGMRRTFISNVSHELKTPMTTIAGFIDGMLDGTIPPERQPHYMKIVSNEVKRLSRLVTSMLSLSRIDRGELRVSPQKFDLFSMLITILASYEQKIVEKKLHITGLEDFKSITVFADPDLMYQVIYNLIENAVKFTNEGGTLHFGVEETRYDTSVSISNTGPGIPPEDIRFIFDRFYKTDKSRSIDKKGMGLGLFIAKTIMRLHGGDIFVESRVNELTTFTIRLPRAENRSAANGKQPKNTQYIDTTANSETEE